jgi:hypothetical protein
MTELKDVPREAYGFWARAGDWVGSHGRTMLTISIALIAFFALILAIR